MKNDRNHRNSIPPGKAAKKNNTNKNTTGKNTAGKRPAGKNTGQKPHAPTSKAEAEEQKLEYWQPERLSFSDGIKQLSWPMRGLYILLIAATAWLNLTSWHKLPDKLELLTWFGYSSATVPSIAYFIVTFLLIVYLVYRDIVNRSLSRRKLFIPVIFYFGNYFMIEQLLSTLHP